MNRATTNPSVEVRKQLKKPLWLTSKIYFNGGVLIALTVYFLLQVQNPTLLEFMVFPVMLVMGSFTVWAFHRYPLHRRYKIITYPYKKHTVEHHNFYTYQDLEISSFREIPYIMFGVFDVIGFALFFVPAVYFGLSTFLPSNLVNMIVASCSGYFIIYEVFHTISHLPASNFLLKIPMLKFMWNHHRIHHHHKYMHKVNFNIVFPLFDWLMGTLITEIPTKDNAKK